MAEGPQCQGICCHLFRSVGETIQIFWEKQYKFFRNRVWKEIIAFKELRKTLWTIYLPGNV